MRTECTAKSLDFQALVKRKVVARFDGGAITFDAGGLLLGQCERDRKQLRKRQPRPSHTTADGESPSVNVADLKKRIFNRNVSRENVIKALDALPSAERKAVIADLPPGLRRRLAEYLK